MTFFKDVKHVGKSVGKGAKKASKDVGKTAKHVGKGVGQIVFVVGEVFPCLGAHRDQPTRDVVRHDLGRKVARLA